MENSEIQYKIAIAEDSKLFIATSKNMIKSSIPNCEIDTYNSISELKSILNPNKKYEIIILDLNFPDGNSLGIIKKIKAVHSDVSIIVISAQSEIRTALKTLDAGADSYICKGNTFTSDLYGSLKNLIKKIDLSNQNKKLKEGIFDPSNYPFVVYKLTEMGVDVIYKDFNNFPEQLKMSTDEFLINEGITFIMLLRGGDKYHEGCFMFPAGQSEFYSSLLFSFRIPDPKAVDPRLKLGFYQIVYFVPNSFKPVFPIIDELSIIIDDIKNIIGTATKINSRRLKKLKVTILNQIKELA